MGFAQASSYAKYNRVVILRVSVSFMEMNIYQQCGTNLQPKFQDWKSVACKDHIIFMIFLSKNFNLFFVELKTPTNSVCHQLSTTHWSDALTPIQKKSNFVVVNNFVLGITYFTIFHQPELFGHGGVDLVLHSNSSGFNMGPRLDMKSLRMGNISNFWKWSPIVALFTKYSFSWTFKEATSIKSGIFWINILTNHNKATSTEWLGSPTIC